MCQRGDFKPTVARGFTCRGRNLSPSTIKKGVLSLDRRTFLVASGAVVSGSPSSSAQTPSQNPFLQKWTTPYELPPFDQIKPVHFVPAFREGMKQELAEVEAIASSKDAATFANTVEKLERSGELLTRVQGVFYNLTASDRKSVV